MIMRLGFPEGLLTNQSAAVWHEFYALAGGAAVTLVGLLFVSLSFHLDTLLDDHHRHLLAAARLTFMNFIFVLMLSLFMLIPEISPQMLGVACFVLSTVSLAGILADSLKNRIPRNASAHEKFLQRRYAMTGVIMGLAITASAMLVLKPKAILLYEFVPVVCAVLANASGMSWDLLVQVARIRRAHEAEKA